MNIDSSINDKSLFRALIEEGIKSDALRSVCRELEQAADFWTWPASLSFHHAYEGGLIAHTLEVVNIALHMADKFPAVNRDVLVTAALWHDFGKTSEYTVVEDLKEGQRNLFITHCDAYTQYWVETDYKNRIGHISGSAIDFAAMATQHGVDPETIQKVVHCILSHHGPVKEWGSPVAPESIEAWLLHQADMLSAKYGATK